MVRTQDNDEVMSQAMPIPPKHQVMSDSMNTCRSSKRTRAARRLVVTGLLAALMAPTTGCFGISTGPSLGIFGLPIPVSPYYQHRQEEKFWEHERYERVPVLGPTTAGGAPVALDPPTDDEVVHALLSEELTRLYNRWLDAEIEQSRSARQRTSNTALAAAGKNG